MKTTMMNAMRSTRTIAATTALIAGAIGMGPFAPSDATAQIRSVADVKTLLKQELPAGALEIASAMKSAKVGDTITVRGNVAMSKDAFVENRAMFTLVDESMRKGCCPPSDKLPDTACNIPAEGRATVQILDASGRILRVDLSGQHGLKPGAEVFVTGKIETANGTDALVLTATSMHVPKAPLPSGFFVGTQPEGAVDVTERRRTGSLKAGDEVVLRGRVGGSEEPFVAGRAVFTLIGRGLKACSENPGDNCSKPWDYCCETREDILANSATVQLVDDRGQILRTDLRGRRGLKELSEIVVVGKVESTEGKALLVNATAIYLAQ